MRKHRWGAAVVSLALAAVGTAVTATPAVAAPVSDALDGAQFAAESMAAGRIDLFTRGSDGHLHWKFFSSNQWSGWEDLGGPITSAPTVASWANGRLDVFARSASNSLVHKWYLNGTWYPGWEDLGGVITSAPAVASWGTGRLDVFARGGNAALYHKFFAGGWHAWESLGGSLSTAPAVAAQAANKLNVVFRGTGTNNLYHKGFNGAWSATTNLGGTLASAPTIASWANGRLDVFFKGTSGSLTQRYFANGAWSSAFVDLGGTLTGAPAASSWGTGHLDVFAQDVNGDLQQKTYNSPSWGSFIRKGPLDPIVPLARDNRIVGVQSGAQAPALGPIEYAYVNNAGRIVQGLQTDPASTGSVQWSTVPGDEAFVGEPALIRQPDGRVQELVQNQNGDIAVRTESTPGSGTFATGDAGGWVTSGASAARLPDGRVTTFTVDSDGTLLNKTQAAVNGAYGTWRNLGDVDLADAPTLAATRTGVQLFALDRTGTLRTAAMDAAGALGAWTTLGGPGWSGRPTAVVYPGFRLAVFARAADGSVVTKRQDLNGAFPAAWDAVGTFTAAGPPVAVLSPKDSVTYVVARGTDNLVHWTRETDLGSWQWEAWRDDNPLVISTDPTIVAFDPGTGSNWGYLVKTPNNEPFLFVLTNPAGLTRFTANRLPTPPQ